MIKSRLLVVLGAVLATVVLWLLAEVVLGTDLRAPAMDGAGDNQDVNVGAVIISALVASVVGWGVLALLERFTRRGWLVWTVLATVVAVISLGGPFSGSGVSTGNRLWLAAMHVAVAAILIPGLLLGARRRSAPAAS
jgi:hypothetical protein